MKSLKSRNKTIYRLHKITGFPFSVCRNELKTHQWDLHDYYFDCYEGGQFSFRDIHIEKNGNDYNCKYEPGSTRLAYDYIYPFMDKVGKTIALMPDEEKEAYRSICTIPTEQDPFRIQDIGNELVLIINDICNASVWFNCIFVFLEDGLTTLTVWILDSNGGITPVSVDVDTEELNIPAYRSERVTWLTENALQQYVETDYFFWDSDLEYILEKAFTTYFNNRIRFMNMTIHNWMCELDIHQYNIFRLSYKGEVQLQFGIHDSKVLFEYFTNENGETRLDKITDLDKITEIVKQKISAYIE